MKVTWSGRHGGHFLSLGNCSFILKGCLFITNGCNSVNKDLRAEARALMIGSNFPIKKSRGDGTNLFIVAMGIGEISGPE